MDAVIQRYGFVGLPQGHLINQVTGTGVLVNHKEDVANVYRNAALQLVLKEDVTTH